MPLSVPIIDQVMDGSISFGSVATYVRAGTNPLVMVNSSLRAAGDTLGLNGCGS